MTAAVKVVVVDGTTGADANGGENEAVALVRSVEDVWDANAVAGVDVEADSGSCVYDDKAGTGLR